MVIRLSLRILRLIIGKESFGRHQNLSRSTTTDQKSVSRYALGRCLPIHTVLTQKPPIGFLLLARINSCPPSPPQYGNFLVWVAVFLPISRPFCFLFFFFSSFCSVGSLIPPPG